MAKPARTWQIQDWNSQTQSLEAPRTVTLAQFRAELEARKALALQAYRDAAAKVQRQPRATAATD